jgi:glycerophosphoryl diester phosphodiesterase
VRGPKPENTLAAIREAAAQGADAVEIDVRTCASGEVVVFHDPDLSRFGGSGVVSKLSLGELGRVDLGAGERIPRLEEALDLARALSLGVNVEIKHDVPDRARVVRKVARVLSDWDRGHDVVVSSFDPVVLAMHRAFVPRLAHALLVHESTYHDWALRIARAGRVDGVHTEVSLTVAARIGTFVGRGFVNTWTVNDPREARRAFELGVSAVITDRPAHIRAAFEAPP